MGFGLDIAPQIMSKILSTVLSIDHAIAAGTDHYIDGIFMNEQIVPVDVVREHLLKFGEMTKDPVPISDVKVLGLSVYKGSDGMHSWHRDDEIPSLNDNGQTVTKRELYSICAKLIGHLPVAGFM